MHWRGKNGNNIFVHFKQFLKWLFVGLNCENGSPSNIRRKLNDLSTLQWLLCWNEWISCAFFCFLSLLNPSFVFQILKLLEEWEQQQQQQDEDEEDDAKRKKRIKQKKQNNMTPNEESSGLQKWLHSICTRGIEFSEKLLYGLEYIEHFSHERVASILFKCCGQKRDDNKLKFDTKISQSRF